MVEVARMAAEVSAADLADSVAVWVADLAAEAQVEAGRTLTILKRSLMIIANYGGIIK